MFIFQQIKKIGGDQQQSTHTQTEKQKNTEKEKQENPQNTEREEK